MHPLVAANLGDFIDSFNVFVMAIRVGLNSIAFNSARRIAKSRARSRPRRTDRPCRGRGPIACHAGRAEALSEQVDAAIGAPDDINGDQAAELARKTAGNFVSELLRRAYAPIQKLGGVVTAETKVALKEYRAGIYRAAGTATFAGGAYLCWPDISSFVVRNADALML